MSGMKVNFNNLRKQAMFSYERLCDKLNYAIIKNDEQHAQPNGSDYSTNLKGYVLIDTEEIQKEMDSLRSLIGSIAMTYEDNNEDFKDVYEEVFPEEKGGRLPCFNEEDDE